MYFGQETGCGQPPGPRFPLGGRTSPPPPPYLGEVLGDATPTVGIRDLGMLQVHDPLSHILIEQNSPVVTSCRGGWWTHEAVQTPGA